MNTFKHIGKHLLAPAFLATAAGPGAPVTLAGIDTAPTVSSIASPRLQLAYSKQRWPVYRNVHREQEPAKVHFARFEEKPATHTERQTPKGRPTERHRRSPNHKAWR